MKTGFTLIELLVVVAVVALLVSLMLPSFGSARHLAAQTVCASNMRTMALGLGMYAQKNRDWLPTAEPPMREFPDSRHWFLNAELLADMGTPLRKAEDGTIIGPPTEGTVLVCPSHDDPCLWRDGVATEYGLSYGMNGTWGLGGRPDHVKQRRMTEFTVPWQVMVLMDAVGTQAAPGIVLYKGCAKDNMAFRHRGKANVVFVDGRIEALGPPDVPLGMENRYEAFWSAEEP